MLSRDRSVWLPTIHPFTASGDLDEQALRNHFERLASAGICVLVANEGTGESHTFSWSELERVLDIAADELVGRVPVVGMGRMARTAEEMIRFVAMVQSAGLDGVHVYTLDMGHGMRPTEAEQEAYLVAVLERCEIPVVLSLNMVAGWLYPVELVERMAERFPLVVGAILTSTDVDYLGRLLDTVGDRLNVHTVGWNAMTTLALGGRGFAFPEANIAPRTAVSLLTCYEAGRYAEAEDAFRVMMALDRMSRRYGKGAIKASLDILGLPGGPPRPPRLPLDEQARAAIAATLEGLDIARREGLAG